jgi:hypothetical protein
MLVYLMTIWNILQQFCTIYGRLVHCAVIWYIFSSFGMLGASTIWQPWVRAEQECGSAPTVRGRLDRSKGVPTLFFAFLLFGRRCCGSAAWIFFPPTTDPVALEDFEGTLRG